ncbi:hypothetical protein [Brevibacillus sp. MER 51]|uniref:hypothetical protein n=1 Tax=Brevibacillus sp. MER 51 TaxID=2939560 RepID=UPI00203E84C9|nr:hypothetical protein [Brevibacillus sp. MER 51]MCM3142322.1 hypothetical protein [Brevibacillus sp. MER 51]
MSKLLSYKEIRISSSTSPIAYKQAGYRQRFLTIEGKEIANTGIDCETCLFYADVSGMDMKSATKISNRKAFPSFNLMNWLLCRYKK